MFGNSLRRTSCISERVIYFYFILCQGDWSFWHRELPLYSQVKKREVYSHSRSIWTSQPDLKTLALESNTIWFKMLCYCEWIHQVLIAYSTEHKHLQENWSSTILLEDVSPSLRDLDWSTVLLPPSVYGNHTVSAHINCALFLPAQNW